MLEQVPFDNLLTCFAAAKTGALTRDLDLSMASYFSQSLLTFKFNMNITIIHLAAAGRDKETEGWKTLCEAFQQAKTQRARTKQSLANR